MLFRKYVVIVRATLCHTFFILCLTFFCKLRTVGQKKVPFNIVIPIGVICKNRVFYG